jgi:hypothetical protein
LRCGGGGFVIGADESCGGFRYGLSERFVRSRVENEIRRDSERHGALSGSLEISNSRVLEFWVKCGEKTSRLTLTNYPFVDGASTAARSRGKL